MAPNQSSAALPQEQLAERSGISVRTIRNCERGLVDRPRRGSVDMLLARLTRALSSSGRHDWTPLIGRDRTWSSWGEFAQPESVELLADLVDASLLQVERGRRYEYRMLRHVQAVIADDPEPIDEPKALEPVTV